MGNGCEAAWLGERYGLSRSILLSEMTLSSLSAGTEPAKQKIFGAENP
jgi:hypothetical protein